MTVIPFEVDVVRFIVEECNQGEEFWEGRGYDIFEFFTGDAVELVS